MAKTVFVVMAGALALVLTVGCEAEPTTAEASCPPCPTCPVDEECPPSPTCPAAEECPVCPTCEPCKECPEPEPCAECEACPEPEPCPTCPAPVATVPPGASETFSLEIVQVQDPSTSWSSIYDGPPEGERLVAADIIVSNLTDEPQSINPLDALLVDSEGYVYGCETGSASDQLNTANILAGEKIRGWVGFEVPVGAKPARIRYGDSWGDEFAIADIP